jgi:hypothetical protein
VWEFFPKGEDKMRYLTALVLTAALAGVASAQISGEVVYTDPTPAVGTIPANTYVTNDLMATCTSDWLSAVLIVTPDAPGMIYQDGFGSDTSTGINPAFFPMAPSMEYDSFVSNGTYGESIATADPVDQGYVKTFTATSIAIAWFTTDIDDLGLLRLARITLSNQAQGDIGSWYLKATALKAGVDEQGQPLPPYTWEITGYIEDGKLMVPEPATMALLGIGGLAALIRRKRA